MRFALLALAVVAAAFPQEEETAAAPAPGPVKGTPPTGGAAPVAPAGGQLAGAGAVPGTLASGPYKSAYWAEPTLPTHTIFGPIAPPANLKMPVMIWGNGACSGNGTYFKRSLYEVASRGFFVIANGNPTGGAGTTSALQKASLNWIEKNAGKGKWANVDGKRIAVAGQSCGGLETYDVATDPRVSVVGIFNSGEFGTPSKSTKVTKPIFYFLGGSSDIAYANGERDYKALPATTPKWKGNLPVGHMATWSTTNGGKFGKAEWMWLDYTLRGSKTSQAFFLGEGAKADGWVVESKNMDKYTPLPAYT
ncbi:hypothetical protein EJ08DRAFT_677857 [Tothia fuscella]|uniref:Uncharacterized protein n=1 Tax=Tothia fuscella TaxID=1048955 RepID=A0A9P4NUR4_9PEZI|nr:hypothetical protein EJ08DRAFT_677857 [Tothia fuscella]